MSSQLQNVIGFKLRKRSERYLLNLLNKNWDADLIRLTQNIIQTIDHDHMVPIARLGGVGRWISWPARGWISAGAMILVAELNTSDITIGPSLAGCWTTETLARA